MFIWGANVQQKGNGSARFYGLCQESASKKSQIENLRRYDKKFWNTFTKLASDYAKIDIIFDLYTTFSIKQTERNRRNAVETISTDKFESEHHFFWTQKNLGS